MKHPVQFLTPVCIRPVAAALLTLLLAGCGDTSSTLGQPEVIGRAAQVSYTGIAPPASDDVTAFQREVWIKLAPTNMCGTCHATNQAPLFVRGDDINLAYNAVLPLVDLANPGNSRLVERVRNGHNCWSDDNDVCAEVMTGFIQRWADASIGGPAATVVLTAPPEIIPGETKNFPADSALFGETVWREVNEYCSRCHSPGVRNAQAPYFAQDDIDAAYAAARNTISLNVPENSRLVQRLANESHNCWLNDCDNSAAIMLAAVRAMANAISPTELPDGTIASRALGLLDGIVASSGGRYEGDIIAKYEFKEGSGTRAHDTSGVLPTLDLNLSGAVTWVGSGGLRFEGGKAQGSTINSRKLHDLLTVSGEYSIEAWVIPANTAQQGPARIVSYSGGADVRNFMLGQSMYIYNFLNRNEVTDGNGAPALSTTGDLLQASQQHVVVTYTAAGGRRIYVNGEYSGDLDPVGAGAMGSWNNSFALVLGSEVDGTRSWRGVTNMVAIHGRALTPEQVAQNFKVGIGQRYFLLFAIGHIIGEPDTYILFDGSEFDDYSYLLSEPRVIKLNDPDHLYAPSSIPLAGMRIGVNARVPEVGQAFATLDTEIDAANWIGSSQPLAHVGTIIPKENGKELDQLFLTFERLGPLTNVQTPSMSLTPPAPIVGVPVSDIGLRLFETINASLSEITTVPMTRTAVAAMYEQLKQQLPASDLITGFSSAQQIGITQLAIEYCNALVDDPISSVYFPTFALDQPYTSALDTPAERSALIDPLVMHVTNNDRLSGLLPELTSMPAIDDMSNELDALVIRLMDSCTGTCAADPVRRTETIAKAVCAAASANAAMLVQ